MQIDEALAGVSRLFLDTASIIYFVERSPQFVSVIDPVSERLDLDVTAVVSPVTLAECLVGAQQLGLTAIEQTYLDICSREDVIFIPLDQAVARESARIRVQYNLRLPDGLQIAAARVAGYEAFLTNDAGLARVTEIRVLLISALEVS